MSKFKQELLTRFQGTDEGEVKEYLGCEVIRDRAARTGKMVQSNQRQSSQDGQNGISIFLDMLSVSLLGIVGRVPAKFQTFTHRVSSGQCTHRFLSREFKKEENVL